MSILDEHIEPHLTTFADVSGVYGVLWGNDIDVSSTNNMVEEDLFNLFNTSPVLAWTEFGRAVIDTFINGLGQLVLPYVDTKIPINERFTFRLTQGTATINDHIFRYGLELLYCEMVVFAYFYTNHIDEMVLVAQYYGGIKKEEPW